jgi:hypothetical protein
MIVFQAEHNILMHPFHMLGNLNASPPVYFLDFYKCTLIGFWILQKLLDDKGRLKTRLNGGSSLGLLFLPYKFNLNFCQEKIKKVIFFKISENNEDFLEEKSKEEIESSRNNPVPNRIAQSLTSQNQTRRQLPGVYMIICLYNNKRYYGQSENVLSRLSQHKSRLQRNIHEVSEMQRDWNLYGETNFQFSVIFISKNCTKAEREALELEYIARHFNICYNKFHKNNRKQKNNLFRGYSYSEETPNQINQSLSEFYKDNPPEGLAIKLKGELYPSISEASRQTKHSRDTIRRWLKDPQNLDCIQIDVS